MHLANTDEPNRSVYIPSFPHLLHRIISPNIEPKKLLIAYFSLYLNTDYYLDESILERDGMVRQEEYDSIV